MHHDDISWTPLPTQPENGVWTRPITLQSGKPQEPLKCRLDLALITNGRDNKDSHSYQALSYVCGDLNEDRQTIFCNSHHITIGRNLFKALQALRQLEGDVTIWCDELSVNQSENEEKSAQVARFYAVYSNASQVLIYLGPLTNSVKAAIRYAKDLFRLYLQVLLWQKPTHVHKPAFISLRTDPNESAFRQLLSNPWHTRMWTVQEGLLGVVHNKNPPLFLWKEDRGLESLSMDATVFFAAALSFRVRAGFDLRGTSEQIHTFSRVLLTVDKGWHLVKSWNSYLDEPLPKEKLLYLADRIRGRIQTDPTEVISFEPTLPAMLRELHYRQSTDKRDKLFALYGLSSMPPFDFASDFLHSRLTPDYSLSAQEVYTRAALICMFRERSLGNLSFCTPFTHRRMPGLPSWCPDWSAPPIPCTAWRPGSVASFASGHSLCSPRREGHSLFVRADMKLAALLSYRLHRRNYKLGKLYAAFHDFVFCFPDKHAYADLHKAYASVLQQRALDTDEWRIYARFRKAQSLSAFLRKLQLPLLLTEMAAMLRETPGPLWLQRRPDLNDPNPYRRFMIQIWQHGRRLAWLDGNGDGARLASVPWMAKVGDQVCLLEGGPVPVVLRKEGEGRALQVIGDAYVDGWMNWEAWEEGRCREMELT